MNPSLARSYMSLAEKKRGQSILLTGDDCDELAHNAILSNQFNQIGTND